MNNEIESTLHKLSGETENLAHQAADATQDAAQTARERAGTALHAAREKTGELLHTARDRTAEALHVAKDRTSEALHTAKDQAQHALHTAKDKTNQALDQSSAFVRQNPLPMLLGALAVGLVVGAALSRREEEERTFRQRLGDDPMNTAREAIYAVLSPIADRLHSQYDTARSGAHHAMDKINSRHNRRAVDNIFSQARRTANHLKFW